MTKLTAYLLQRDAARGQDNSTAAFALGFHETRMGRGLDTARKVAREHPELTGEEIRCYLNGGDDARMGDSWRLDHIARSLPEGR